MSTFSENQAMKPTDGGMISYRWPGLQLALSLYTRLKRAAGETSRDQHCSAGSSCRADMSAHSSANIYRISGEDEETRKDCRWFEAESSEQTSWTQNQNCAVTTRLLLRLKAVCEALSCDHVTAAPCFSLSALRPVQTLASCSSLLWFTGRSQKQLLAEWREWDESWRRDAMMKQKNKLVS